MFDLERSIAEWRQQLRAAGITKPEILDELESHLREDMERRVQSGAAEEHVWNAAVASLGDTHALQAEFARSNRPRTGSRKAFQAFYFGSVAFVVLVNVWNLIEFEESLIARCLGIAAVSLMGSYLAWLPHLLRSGSPAARESLARSIKVASNLVWLWPVCALLQAAGVVKIELGILPATILWCLCATIGLSAVAYILEQYRRPGGPENPPWAAPCSGVPIPPVRPGPSDLTFSLSKLQAADPVLRQSFDIARSEASRLGHGYVGTEHLLLGMLNLAEEPLAKLLQRMGVDRQALRAEVERIISPWPRKDGATERPLTPRAKKAIALAAREAKALDRGRVGPEHVLLGLLLEGSGVAAQALRKLGVGIQKVRKEMPSASGDEG